MSRHGLLLTTVRPWVALGAIAFLATASIRPASAETRPLDLAAPPPPSAPPALSPLAPAPTPTVHRRNAGFIATGAVMFGLTWGLAVLFTVAAIGSRSVQLGDALTYSVPIVGPVAEGTNHHMDMGLMVFWSATELLGVVLFGLGMKGQDVPATAHW
jgi:hypothetical protein